MPLRQIRNLNVLNKRRQQLRIHKQQQVRKDLQEASNVEFFAKRAEQGTQQGPRIFLNKKKKI